MQAELKNKILQETSDIAHSMSELNDVINQIKYSQLPLVENRLLNWIDFFNEYRSCSGFCFYLPMLEALIETSIENELFRSQTGHEFNLSKLFFENISKSKNHFIVSDKVTAKKLLVLSIVYSKYSGMVLTSTIKLFNSIRANMLQTDVDEIFTRLFVKYETPSFLVRNFECLRSTEMEVLMNGLQGNNLRKHYYFPAPLSKKEFFNIMSLDFTYEHFDNALLLRAAIIVKFNINQSQDGKLSVFLRASNTFCENPTLYFHDIDFWKRAFELISDDGYEYNFMGISDCVDFFEFKKYQEGGYSLKGRTVNSVSQAILVWHTEIYNAKSDLLRKQSWEGIEEPNINFKYKSFGFECIQLLSGQELYEEGKKLSHCVITYTNYCVVNSCSIWSLRRIDETKVSHLLTIEIRDNTIVQARRKHNLVPNKNELQVLKYWANRMDFKIDLHKND